MSSYRGGGVSSGGGGSISENAGGLNEGTRMRCIGRGTVESFGPPICAACGRVIPATAIGDGGSVLPLGRPMLPSVGTKPGGDGRRDGASGHPHSGTLVPLTIGSGDE